MIVLDEPYVSEPLVAWLEESGHPVLDNAPARDLAAQGRALNLVPEDEAARRLGAGRARVRQFRERPGVDRRPCGQPGPRTRHPAVQGQGAHARGAETARSGPVFPDLLGGRAVQTRLRTTGNAVRAQAFGGLLRMGVHAVHDRDDGSVRSPTSPERIRLARPLSRKRGGHRVVMLEGYLEGTEYALDAYFDETGAAHVLDVLRHDFAGPADTSDRLYVTSAPLVRVTRPCSNRGSTA